MFWLSMRLPCRHVFVARSSLDMGLFLEDLCDKRWSLEYYKCKQRIFLDVIDDDDYISAVDM